MVVPCIEFPWQNLWTYLVWILLHLNPEKMIVIISTSCQWWLTKGLSPRLEIPSLVSKRLSLISIFGMNALRRLFNLFIVCTKRQKLLYRDPFSVNGVMLLTTVKRFSSWVRMPIRCHPNSLTIPKKPNARRTSEALTWKCRENRVRSASALVEDKHDI